MFQEKINFEEAKKKALDVVRRKGPVMPSQVAKEIQIPPLFASALLSQLITEKVVRVSHLKVGGSPLYYADGHKQRLLEFLNYLPHIEKDVCERLQKEGVMEDEKLTLAEKVALRNLKDFSVPLSVKIGEEKRIFWRWFELPQEVSVKKIEEILRVYQKEEPIAAVEAVKTVKEEPIEEIKEKELLEKVQVRERIREKIERKHKEAKETKEAKEFKKAEEIDFLEEIKSFLSSNKVKVLEEKVIRKNSEVELLLQLNSSLGKMNFFAIAKNKKVLTAADLMLAYYRGQERKLPLILLNSGRFAKNADEKANELGITLKSLEEGEKQEKLK